jgi:hypothetical protein
MIDVLEEFDVDDICEKNSLASGRRPEPKVSKHDLNDLNDEHRKCHRRRKRSATKVRWPSPDTYEKVDTSWWGLSWEWCMQAVFFEALHQDCTAKAQTLSRALGQSAS